MGLRNTLAGGFVAALVASLALAGPAFAEAPEFGRCVAVAKGMGKYSTSKCTAQAAGGNFEWLQGAGAKNKFTLTTPAGKTITLIETVTGTKVICTAGKAEGEYSGPQTVKLATRLEGCKTSGGEVESAGQPMGVVLEPLKGVLGIVKKGTTAVQDKVALDFSPEATGGPVGQMACNGIPIELKGSVISHELTVNAKKLASVVKFLETKGRQKPESFEGVPKDVLEMDSNGGPFAQSGLNWETTQTNEEAIEINTVF